MSSVASEKDNEETGAFEETVVITEVQVDKEVMITSE